MDLSDRIRYIREAGQIERCHLWPKVRPYNNAAHTYGVCVILRLLWPDDRHLLDFAMFHDVPERKTGDIASPTIGRIPGLVNALEAEERGVFKALALPDEHALSDDDWDKLRAADSLDLWLWTFEEEALGNQVVLSLREEMDASWDRKHATRELPGGVYDLITEFRQKPWRRHKGV
jgi:5'-deoxynucleotidase YfbR-like HD superfamily hydrolase